MDITNILFVFIKINSIFKDLDIIKDLKDIESFKEIISLFGCIKVKYKELYFKISYELGKGENSLIIEGFDIDFDLNKIISPAVNKYNPLSYGIISIENNKLLLKNYFIYSKDSVFILSSKSDKIILKKSINYDKNTYQTEKTEYNIYNILEDSRIIRKLFFELLMGLNPSETLKKSLLSQFIVDNYGRILSASMNMPINGYNLEQSIRSIMKEVINNSDGMNYGLLDLEIYLDIFINIDTTFVLRLPNWDFKKFRTEIGGYDETNETHKIKSTYFTRNSSENIGIENQIQSVFKDFNLQIKSNDDTDNGVRNYNIENNNTKNFSIIPFMCNGHISTLLIDLREKDKNGFIIPYNKRLYSFDSSTYHYEYTQDKDGDYILKPRKDIFGDLSDCVTILSHHDLQLEGCCGFWAKEFIRACDSKNSIVDIIENIDNQYNAEQTKIKSDILEKTISEVFCNFSNIIKYNISLINFQDPFYIQKIFPEFSYITFKDINRRQKYFLEKLDLLIISCLNMTSIIKYEGILSSFKRFFTIENIEEIANENKNLKLNEVIGKFYKINEEFLKYFENLSCFLIEKVSSSNSSDIKEEFDISALSKTNEVFSLIQNIKEINKQFFICYRKYQEFCDVFIKLKDKISVENKEQICNEIKNRCSKLNIILGILTKIKNEFKGKKEFSFIGYVNLPSEIKSLEQIIKENCHNIRKLPIVHKKTSQRIVKVKDDSKKIKYDSRKMGRTKKLLKTSLRVSKGDNRYCATLR